MKLHTFKIMQEAGPQARARRAAWCTGSSYVEPKCVGTVEGPSEVQAFRAYVTDRYPAGHKQYRGYRLEWRSRNALKWREDDGDTGNRSREYSMVVTLQNGAYAHEIRLLAWKV